MGEVFEAGNRAQAFSDAADFRTVAFVAEKHGFHGFLYDGHDFPELTPICTQPPGRPLHPLRRRVGVRLVSSLNLVNRCTGNGVGRFTAWQATLRAVETRTIVFHLS